jgi:hypothetical protein
MTPADRSAPEPDFTKPLIGEPPSYANIEMEVERVASWVTLDDILVKDYGRGFVERELQVHRYELSRYVMSLPGETLTAPYSWWDHFKLRWFPRWASARWPAKMRTWRAYQMLPHAPHLPSDWGRGRAYFKEQP